MIWLKVNAIAAGTKWLTLSAIGFALEWTPQIILFIGIGTGLVVTIITLPKFKLLFIINRVIGRILSGKKAAKPS